MHQYGHRLSRLTSYENKKQGYIFLLQKLFVVVLATSDKR